MRRFLQFVLLLLCFGCLQAQSPKPVVLFFAGDVTLSDNVEKYVGNDTTYVFRRWQPGRESDVFMVNLEHPVTTAVERVEKKYNFKLDPSLLGILKHGGVTLVNCANNHVFDYGLQGIEDTMRNLDSVGVKYVGIGKNLGQARTPVVMDIRGKTIGFLGYFGSGDYAATSSRPGFAPRYTKYIVNDVTALRKKVDFVVVNFHWGTERAPVPEQWQRDLAHRVIDAGADLIVGHHPHVLQGIEVYNDKYIVYSLGNFVFGGNTQHTYETALLRVSVGTTVDVDVVPVSVRKWQPSPAVGESKERILSLINERTRLLTAQSTEAGVLE